MHLREACVRCYASSRILRTTLQNALAIHLDNAPVMDNLSLKDVGRIFYTRDGRTVRLLGFVINSPEGLVGKHSYLVAAQTEDPESGDFYDGHEYTTYGPLYASAPVVAKSEVLTALHEKIAAAKKDLAELHATITSTDTEFLAVQSKIAAHAHLRFVLDYLEGDVLDRPACLTSYGVIRVELLRDIIQYEDAYYKNSKHLKLLTLYGDSKGNLTWKLSHYSDGSGSCGYEIEIADRGITLAEYCVEKYREAINGAIANNDLDKLATYMETCPEALLPEHRNAYQRMYTKRGAQLLVKKAEELAKIAKEIDDLKTKMGDYKHDTNDTDGI